MYLLVRDSVVVARSTASITETGDSETSVEEGWDGRCRHGQLPPGFQSFLPVEHYRTYRGRAAQQILDSKLLPRFQSAYRRFHSFAAAAPRVWNSLPDVIKLHLLSFSISFFSANVDI